MLLHGTHIYKLRYFPWSCKMHSIFFVGILIYINVIKKGTIGDSFNWKRSCHSICILLYDYMPILVLFYIISYLFGLLWPWMSFMFTLDCYKCHLAKHTSSVVVGHRVVVPASWGNDSGHRFWAFVTFHRCIQRFAVLQQCSKPDIQLRDSGMLVWTSSWEQRSW